MRRPKKLETEGGHGQSTKEHALYGLIHYFSVTVQEKSIGFFCSVFALPAKKIKENGITRLHGDKINPIIVSLSSVNHRFWSQFGCSESNDTIFICQNIFFKGLQSKK